MNTPYSLRAAIDTSVSESSESSIGHSSSAITLVWRPDASLIHGLPGSTSWMDAMMAFRKSSCKQLQVTVQEQRCSSDKWRLQEEMLGSLQKQFHKYNHYFEYIYTISFSSNCTKLKTCLHPRVPACVCVCVCMCIHVCMHVYVFACLYACMLVSEVTKN